MGLIHFKKNDTEEAASYLRRAVEVDPKNAKTYYLLGVIYALQAENRKSADDYRLAEEALRNSLNYDPGLVSARVLLAQVYLALGDGQRAREQAEAAIRYTSDPVTMRQVKSMLNAIDAGR